MIEADRKRASTLTNRAIGNLDLLLEIQGFIPTPVCDKIVLAKRLLHEVDVELAKR